MGKLLIIFLFFMVSCAGNRRPRIYPDLYSENLLKENSLYKKHKVFWIHNFKKIAGYGFTNSKQTILSIDKYEFEMAKSRLTLKYYLIADSVGKDAGLIKSKPKFIDLFYFYDSAYLDSVTLSYYKLYNKDSHLLKNSLPKIKRRSHEH